jgi:DNA-binding CsgD family transcriptional regulator
VAFSGAFVGEKLSKLTELAYAAALDDSLWPAWVDGALSYFGAQGAVFGLVDLESGQLRRGHFAFPDADFDRLISEYAAEMARLDPIFRRIATARGSEIFDEQDAFDFDDPKDREFRSWERARVGTSHNLTVSLALGDGLQGGIALNWSPDRVGPVDETRAQLAVVSQHLAAAMRLGMKHNALLEEAWWDGRMANHGHAAVLLDEQGRIIRISGRAEALVAAGDGLTCIEGRLAAADSGCDNRLAAAVGAATADRGACAATVVVVRPSGRPDYRLAVSPLVRSRRFLAPSDAAAIVQILDPDSAAGPLSPLQRELFGLTKREAEVAELLLAGHSLDSLSEVLGMRRNTARNHLQSLFAKTGTNRQSHLVRLLFASRQQFSD